MPVTAADLTFAAQLADAAGAAIRPRFRSNYGLEIKDDASPVTLADREAEAAMRRLIERERPSDGIQGEEYGVSEGSSGRVWVLDPIDGTRSFIAGRPIFGTLIALVEDGWPVLGVIDQPIIGERWIGAVGRGTTFNGQPTQTRRCRDLADALLATTSPALFDDGQLHGFEHVEAKVRSTVLGGDCYSYGTLASGHIDLVVEAGLKLHDFAALVPVVEGAGGTMSDWSGDPLHAGSIGEVIALGDPARLEDVVELLGCRGR
ncbi:MULTISPECIES: histidinol-phosphatase [unclassified Sphingomonas]|uniref:histidinol-phosphatase n=1 Tax=unclassified Sphingomonas TaxID=196159 RepID=UPI0006F27395|nr:MULTISPECIES: histidinol-phosphatase [unclassified Sphingomonas]KQM65413.1 histidinol phosphate phosphatase [Sphingomonas sp. Leaf16]KQN17015.1 histidinol phosphate phosphatase [Sphingomonas sp. Leaf32]KQN17189.1 histidinol phosphate phosphatase [Sphingomonas sp. Leaf29]